MLEITVGVVAGFVAAGFFLVHNTLDLALALNLAGLLPDENTAVTWSLVGQLLQSSLLPMIFQTDTTSSRGVRPTASRLSRLKTISAALLAVGGFVTPLGLISEISSRGTEYVLLVYIPDMSPIGQLTMDRPNFPLSWICGGAACPGAYQGINGTFNSSIPATLTEIFSSATSGVGNTIYGLFDMGYRRWTTSSTQTVDGGNSYVVGTFAPMDTFVRHDKIEAVEGLIVDTKNQTVGYRNHTIPTGLGYGGTWAEDITFISPETKCVDTNLTINFGVDYDYQAKDVYLADKGGFSNIAPQLPTYNKNDPQSNPDLLGRAYITAWLNNVLAMAYFNTTKGESLSDFQNSTVGKKFYLGQGSRYSPRPDSISIMGIDGLYLDNLPPSSLNVSYNQNLPMSVTSYNFTEARERCQGFGEGNIANVSNILIECYMLFGTPYPSDGSEPLGFAQGTNWSQPLYVCATGVSASIKHVDFTINGTAILSNLQVSIEDKVSKDNASKPLWAVEDTGQQAPFWGLVSDKYENATGLSTRRSDKFWLPATSPSLSLAIFPDSLAGIHVFGAILNDLQTILLGQQIFSTADYSGATNFPMFNLWQDLSKQSSSASQIINLIFIDLLASATVGTKSVISNGTLLLGDTAQSNRADVTIFLETVRYRIFFAIPAIVVLMLWVTSIFSILILWIRGRISVSRMKRLLNQTSTGRIVTSRVKPRLWDKPMKQWVEKDGQMKVAFMVTGIVIVEPVNIEGENDDLDAN